MINSRLDENMAKDIWDILGQSGVTDVKLIEFDQVRIKNRQGCIRETSTVFANAEEYLKFAQELCGKTHTFDSCGMSQWLDTRNPEHNVKIVVCWTEPNRPYIHLRKLEKFIPKDFLESESVRSPLATETLNLL